LIKDKDIANDINVNEYLSKLDDIYMDDLFSSIDKSILEEITAVYHEKQISLERKISKICDHLEAIEEETRYFSRVLGRLAWKIQPNNSKFWKATYCLTLAHLFVLLGWNYFVPNHESFTGYHSQGLGKNIQLTDAYCFSK
jgi:hypothetical protein